jgi:hypothetical protein
VCKKAGFLSTNRIFELVCNEREETGVSHMQPECPTSSDQASSSSFSYIASVEEEVFQNGSGVSSKMMFLTVPNQGKTPQTVK